MFNTNDGRICTLQFAVPVRPAAMTGYVARPYTTRAASSTLPWWWLVALLILCGATSVFTDCRGHSWSDDACEQLGHSHANMLTQSIRRRQRGRRRGPSNRSSWSGNRWRGSRHCRDTFSVHNRRLGAFNPPTHCRQRPASQSAYHKRASRYDTAVASTNAMGGAGRPANLFLIQHRIARDRWCS